MIDQHTADLAAYERKMTLEAIRDNWIESRVIQLIEEGMSEASAEQQAELEAKEIENNH